MLHEIVRWVVGPYAPPLGACQASWTLVERFDREYAPPQYTLTTHLFWRADGVYGEGVVYAIPEGWREVHVDLSKA